MNLARQRYLILTAVYLILGGVAGLVATAFVGPAGLVTGVLATLATFAFARIAMRETLTEAAPRFAPREVATTGQVARIVLVGALLVLPLVVANTWIVEALFPGTMATIAGVAVGAIFAAACGALAARYEICARAMA